MSDPYEPLLNQIVQIQPSQSADSNSLNDVEQSNSQKDVTLSLTSLKGISMLISCFLLQALAFGMIPCFGVFQEHLSHSHSLTSTGLALDLHKFSWVGTLCASLSCFFSLPVGFLCDRIGHKPVLFISSFIIPFSLILASFATEVWHLYLTQGILLGIGVALGVMPATSLPVLYFGTSGGLATGITSAGAGVGGMALSYLNGYLLKSMGYRNTLRVNAAVIFIGLIIASTLIVSTAKPNNNNDNNRQLSWKIKPFTFRFDSEIFFNTKSSKSSLSNLLPYSLFGAVGLFHSFAYLIPFYFLSVFVTTELKMSWKIGTGLIAMMNLASGLGRIFFGTISDKISTGWLKNKSKVSLELKHEMLDLYHINRHPLPYRTYSFVFLLTLILSSISVLFWFIACVHPFNEPEFHALDNYILSLLWIFSFLYGSLSGGSITCSSMVAKELFGTKGLTSILGFYRASRGLGFLFGSPLGSHLINIIPFSGYRLLILFDLFMLLLSSAISILIWNYIAERPAKSEPLTNLNLNTYFMNETNASDSSRISDLSPESETSVLLPENIVS